jgi:hypothetical protein
MSGLTCTVTGTIVRDYYLRIYTIVKDLYFFYRKDFYFANYYSLEALSYFAILFGDYFRSHDIDLKGKFGC